MNRKLLLLATGAMLAPLFAGSAQAIPYAFSSNNITGLTVTTTAGAIVPTTATTFLQDAANYTGQPGSTFSASGGVTLGLDVPQACVLGGCGIAENTFAPTAMTTGS